MADQEFLASFGVEIDETSQSGWQGTLTFTQYTPAVGVNDGNGKDPGKDRKRFLC